MRSTGLRQRDILTSRHTLLRHILPYIVYACMLALCTANLFFMHYRIISITGTEAGLRHYEYLDNAASVILDVSLLMLLFLIVTGRRMRCSLMCTYTVTLLWALANIIYARYFGLYISVSAMTQLSNMANGFMIDCMLDGLSSSEAISGLSVILFAVLYRYARSVRTSYQALLWWLVPAAATFCYNTHVVSIIAKENYDNHSFWWNMNRRYYSPIQSTLSPQLTNFTSGTLRTLSISAVNYMTASYQLDEAGRQRIEAEYKDNSLRTTPHRQRPDINNVVFIIVESYLSAITDMKIGNTEVTPYLNALKRDSNVYYNANVHPDIAMGESSDGQFICMTGILPLRKDITINKAQSITLPGLATYMKQTFTGIQTRMIIPTLPSFWSQNNMCQQYGFDRLYSATDYMDSRYGSLNDEQIFDLAMSVDEVSSGPFFTVILTMSMHSPYSHPTDTGNILTDSTLPEKFCNYLTAAHYTDKQIAEYLEHLKTKGLYDKTLIVIAADHHAHSPLFDMEDKLPTDTPLYIINGNIDNNTAWHGPCHQLDIYTTILDVLAIDAQWHGLGHTLLNSSYTPSVNENIYELSEAIIHGDYFK